MMNTQNPKNELETTPVQDKEEMPPKNETETTPKNDSETPIETVGTSDDKPTSADNGDDDGSSESEDESVQSKSFITYNCC